MNHVNQNPFHPDAQWIGLEGGWPSDSTEEHRTLPARYLRRFFTIPAPVVSAEAVVSGLGAYDFFVNGTAVDDRIGAPGYTNFRKRALFVRYVFDHRIHEGHNTVGFVLGNGRFFAPRYVSPTRFTDFGYPRLLFSLSIGCEDGTIVTVVSDSQWSVTDTGPIRTNNEYDGETYDSRREMPGWNKPHEKPATERPSHAALWRPADILAAPTTRLDEHDYPPDRITRTIPAKTIAPSPEGGWIVDFGENFYGCVRCRVSGPRDAIASWTAAYSLDDDGTLRTRDNRDAHSTDTFILSGTGDIEVWNPRFRGQGMRRIHIHEWPGTPDRSSVEGLAIHADMRFAGCFSCSDPQVQQIAENIRRGQRMYRRHGVPLDPDRNERQGWLGDVGANSASDLWNWDIERFYRKWLIDIALDQKADGQLPDVSPAIWPFYSKSIAWPSAFLLIMQNLYRFTGDLSVLYEHYPTLRRWIHWVQKTLVRADYTVNENVYTDWCDTSSMGQPEHKSRVTSGAYISSAYWAYCVRETARIASLIGEKSDAGELSSWATEAHAGFLSRFVDSENAATPGNTQCELALLVGTELCPEHLLPAAGARLSRAILNDADGLPTVGLIGMQWLMEALRKTDNHEAAWALLSARERPSWGYMLSQGATTFWENWDTDTREPGMNSEALLLLAGNLNAYLYEAIAGVRQADDATAFSRLECRPTILGAMHSAKAWYRTPRGIIASSWERSRTTFRWNLAIPHGTDARASAPEGTGNLHIHSVNGTCTHDPLHPDVTVHLGPGSYSLTADIDE